MRSTIRIAVLIALISGTLRAAEQTPFEWFDSLGVPSLAGKRMVALQQPQRDFTMQASSNLGFVISEENGQLTVLATDLNTVVVAATDTAPVDLKEFADQRIDSSRKPPEKPEIITRFGNTVSGRAELFIIARACDANGLKEQAAVLLDIVEKMPSRNGSVEKDAPLAQRIEADLAMPTIWRDVVAFGDPKTPRSELLDRFKLFVKRFPHSQYLDQAKNYVAILEKMVPEDVEREKHPPKPFDQMSKTEQVADLIWQLRDQNGAQWSQPGAPDIFVDPRHEKSAAHQLMAMKYDAVPQLIDAIGDTRFTRTVGFHRGFYFSHYLLTVGDCAERILSQIAHRNFYIRRSTSGSMTRDGETDAAKAEVRKWWEQLQAKGERQLLIDDVSAGTRDGDWQANLLIEKYPDAALAAIAAAIGKADNEDLRASFVYHLRALPGEAVDDFLINQARKGTSIRVRVSAAEALRARKLPQLSAAEAVKIWQDACAATGWNENTTPELVIPLLIKSGTQPAIEAIAKDLSKQPFRIRWAVVQALFDFHWKSGTYDNQLVIVDPNAVNRAEDLLIGELDDTERYMTMSGSRGNKRYESPSVCDMAAFVLTTAFPDSYVFDIEAAPAVRKQQILTIKNAWRAANNLPPLSPPEQPRIDPVSDELVAPLIADVRAQKPGAESRLLALGLGTLPAITKALAAGASPELLAAQKHAACIVRENVLPENAPESLRKLAGGAKGVPLTGAAIKQLILEAIKSLPKETGGFELSASRDGDDTGVLLRVKYLPADFGRHGSDQSVTAAGKSIRGASSTANLSDIPSHPQLLDDFIQSADQALDRPADQDFEIVIRVY